MIQDRDLRAVVTAVERLAAPGVALTKTALRRALTTTAPAEPAGTDEYADADYTAPDFQ